MKAAFVCLDLFHVFACVTAELCSVFAIVGISRTFSLPDCKGSISKVSMQNQLGPKLLVSSLTTHDRPVLKWRLRVTGNAAVEFGVVPSSLAVNLAFQQLCCCISFHFISLHFISFLSIPFRSTPFIPLHSLPLHSTPLHSTPCHPTPVHSIPFRSISCGIVTQHAVKMHLKTDNSAQSPCCRLV